MKSITFSKALPSAMVLFAAGAALFADDFDKKTDVTTNVPIEVPGGVVLQPGTYMFKLMNITGDRHVVQISSEDGKQTYAITFTAAAHRVERTDKTALSFYEMPNGQPEAVKRWFWPGDYDGEEFLYSKKRAAEISQVNNQKVPEAPEDQSPTPLTTNNTPAPAPQPAIPAATPSPNPIVASAAPAPPAPEPPAAAPEPQVVAQANTPAPAPVAPAPAPNSDQSSSQNASASDSSTLPQTASDLPLFTLVGFSAIAAAVVLRRTRRA